MSGIAVFFDGFMALENRDFGRSNGLTTPRQADSYLDI
jgi:hypothetical protein